MTGFFQTYFDLLESIDDSIRKERIVPGLILLYSGIDSFSSLAHRGNETGRKVFKDWVKKWMLEKYPLTCNETDIYSARCGLLHQQVSESDLTTKKEAKEIYYAWGTASFQSLQDKIANSSKKDSVVAVKLEDLVWAFRNGMADCINEIDKDSEWRYEFDEKAKRLFISIRHSD